MTLRRALAALCGLALVACSPHNANDTGGEPVLLVEPPPHGWSVAASSGQAFTDGFEVLLLDRDGAATIKSVAIDGDAEIELVGALLALPEKRLIGAVQYDSNFPPRDPDLGPSASFVEAAGARLERRPAATDDQNIGYELLLGLRVSEQGRYTREAVVVTYESGGSTRQLRIPAELVVCVEMDDAGCGAG